MNQEAENYFASMGAYSDEELTSLFIQRAQEKPLNNYEATTNEFCFAYMRYPKQFEWKGFKKFGWVQQQLLCEKYNIILYGHETRKEKLIRLSKGLTLKNLNKGLDKFNHGVDSFMKVIEPSKQQKELSLPNYKEMSNLLGTSKPKKFKLHNEKAMTDLFGGSQSRKSQTNTDKEIKKLLGLK